MKKKKLIRIIVPICIALVVVGIWMLKNLDDSSGAASTSPDLVTPIDNEDFALEATTLDLASLATYELPIVIDFGADYCAPCKEFKPILEAMHEEMMERAIIKFVDTEKYSDIASEFPVQVIPTQVFINADGTPYVPSEDIGIEFTMYSYADSEEHAFTVHQGGLTEDQMRLILADMGVTE